MPGLYNKYTKLFHSFGDFSAIILSTLIAYYLAGEEINYFFTSQYGVFFLYGLLCWLISTTILSTYKHYRVARTLFILADAFKAVLLYIVFLEATLNIINYISFSRDFLLYHYLILAACVLCLRFAISRIIRYLRRKGYNNKKTIIVGNAKTGKELKDFFYNHPEYGYRFMGFFYDKSTNDPQVIGRVSEVEKYALEHRIDEIYCCAFSLEKEQIIALMKFADNNLIRVKFLPEPNSFTYQRLKTDFYDMLPILVARNIPLDDAINKILKRSFDIAFSSLVIIFVLSWLLPILAIAIKLDSKGSVFFGQERSGIKNKTFRCWKLRSMYINPEANLQLARHGDSRITRVGAFLRKTSLDELPQFFNVLLGEMSVVGPRPHMLKVNQEYAMVAERYMVRHLIKPGVTGLSQVRGYRGDTTENYQVRGRVKLDIFYLENWSFMLDIKIIFFTIYNAIRGDKNAF